MIKAIVFDLDDTLYPEKSYVDSGFRAVDSYLIQEKSVSGFYSKASYLFKSGKRGFIFNEALDSLGVNYSQALIKDLIAVYRNHRPDILISDESKQVLEWASTHFKVGLITDGYKNAQRNKINALDLTQYFDVICVTDELGRNFWKPHEKPYRLVQESLEVDPVECVYVADNPKKDFVTPNRLGWLTVQLVTKSGEYSAFKADKEFQAYKRIDTLSRLYSELT